MSDNFTFIGFSTATILARSKRQWKLYDRELIERDLLNHFNTRPGQRIGRPTFGSTIWEYLMDQKVGSVVNDIRNEIERVCTFDKRIIFDGVQLTESDRGIIANVSLRTNLSEDPIKLTIDFDQRQGLATRGQ